MSTLIRTAGIAMVAAVAMAMLFDRSGTTPMCSAQGKAAPVLIDVDEIGTTAILVGRLKKPLGTLMTVTGKWSIPTGPVKDNSPRFSVTSIDGVELDMPVEFNIMQVGITFKNRKSAVPKYEDWQTLNGVSWTLPAYETGRFRMTPELATGMYGTGYWFRPFTTELVGVLPQ